MITGGWLIFVINKDTVRLSAEIMMKMNGLKFASLEVQGKSKGTNKNLIEINLGLDTIVELVEKTVEQISSFKEAINLTNDNVTSSHKDVMIGTQKIKNSTDSVNKIAIVIKKVSSIIETHADQIEKISEMLGAITHIADQTQLLSLNAAIEAARAGEEALGAVRAAGGVARARGVARSGCGESISANPRGADRHHGFRTGERSVGCCG